jgi:hypothetical protein
LSTTAVPKIVALTAFYDEPPAMIASMLNGLARLRVDHVVALDGAYRLYPDGKPASHPDVWQAFLGAPGPAATGSSSATATSSSASTSRTSGTGSRRRSTTPRASTSTTSRCAA